MLCWSAFSTFFHFVESEQRGEQKTVILVYAPERENTNKVIIVTSLFLLFFEIGEQMKKIRENFLQSLQV